jgi:prophage DNA circulation protein
MAPSTTAVEESALLAKINEVVSRIESKTTDLQNSINSKMKWLPGPLQDKVIAGWNKFTGFLQDCWDALAEIFGNMGSPSTLWNTGDSWSNSVGGPVSAQVQSAEAGSLEVDDNWDGSAADRYRQNLPMQKTALEKMKSTFSDGISSALSDVAKGIIAFWGGLIVALGALVTGIITALGSAATIFGLPAAPFIAAAAALVAVGAFLSGGLILKSVCSSANSTLRQKLNDNTGYREGHWPPATTE